LTPVRDSDVYSFTDAPTSSVHTLGVTASGEGSPHSQRSLVQFDLTGADVAAGRVESAMLRLYVLAPDPNFGTRGQGFRASAGGGVDSQQPDAALEPHPAARAHRHHRHR